MAQVFPTKTNLMNTKKSLELAKLGYDLMDRKKNILVREMMQLIDSAKAIQEQIGQVYEQAYTALKRANFSMGNCDRFAKAVPVENDLSIDFRSVMGVEIPKVTIEQGSTDVRNFGFGGTNSAFDEACRLFREVKELTAQLAEIENGVCRLADAVEKTQKRSNALNNIMIPKFEETIKYISQDLDEKEREEFARLKVIKDNMD
ncbi:MAG: V-type ATP synthase subunit D [Faecalibacterium sp.]|nr:V-type ATP synthase subunit D [Ruminococcus sp.]MCM1392632.1 V-type ATP synthase subunit D [Ruminococcus sp.]MCM1486061.1 V-type ATP synthase subunit D [Faecalibacterium sp.]